MLENCDFNHNFYTDWFQNGSYWIDHKQNSNLTSHLANENKIQKILEIWTVIIIIYF